VVFLVLVVFQDIQD
jgi:hypothetical protein